MIYLRPMRRSVTMAAMISLVGGATATAMLIYFRMIGSPMFRGEEVAFVSVALAGAFLAGLIVGVAFGRKGRKGWMLAAIGAICSTAIGAFLGGLMMFQTLEEAMICVVMIATIIGSTPLIALAWLAMMALVHVIARRSVLVAEVPADLDLVPGPDNL